jgi:23S rRNA pseudouridine1911/1915/1917 synthase
LDVSSHIVFEDNHLLAVNKWAGVPSQGDNTGDPCLIDYAKDYLKIKYQKPGNVFCGLIHRIDRPVSGLVVLAKTSKALARMNELFKERAVQKTYWAVVGKKPPTETGTLIHWLWRNTKNNVTRAFEKEGKDTQRAELSYKVLAGVQGYYLLEIKPVTGRTHQIRSQLAAIGCPIVGDVKYGYTQANEDRSIHLHAFSLQFEHPIKGEKMVLSAPLPKEPLWITIQKRINDQ